MLPPAGERPLPAVRRTGATGVAGSSGREGEAEAEAVGEAEKGDEAMSEPRRVHYANAGGDPICRRLWRAHTKNEPLVTLTTTKVTCCQCLSRMMQKVLR